MKTFTDYVEEIFERAEEEDERDKPDRNVVQQARKAVNMNGKDVTFHDGKTHHVTRQHANKFLQKHTTSDRDSKLSMQTHAQQSHKNFMSHVEEVEVNEADDSMPSKAHIMQMCKDGKSKDEICKMHDGCDQGKLKAMIDDCKKDMNEAIDKLIDGAKEVETVNEISKNLARKYVNKASIDLYHKGHSQGTADTIDRAGGKHPDQEYKGGPEFKGARRVGGIQNATRRLMKKEETSKVGEGYGSMISPETKARVDANVAAPKQDPKTAKLQKKIDGMKKGPASNVAEKLVGDQHKLDHNKDKKIDGQDMKMVRKHGAVKQSNPDNYKPFNKEELSYADHVAKVMSSLITTGK